jgi:choline dehydrogenase-like flavoprotein
MYDAIVIEARCAGAPVAMLLARKGYKVLLLDRSRFPSEIAHGSTDRGPSCSHAGDFCTRLSNQIVLLSSRRPLTMATLP